MIKNLFQLYCMAICFVCAIIGIAGGGVILNDVGDLVFTEVKHLSRLEYYESNDLFLESQSDEANPYIGRSNAVKRYKDAHNGKISDEIITELRTKERLHTLKSIKNSAISSLLTTSLWMVIACLFFFIHLRLYRKQRN